MIIEASDENDGNDALILLPLDDFQKSTNLPFWREYLNEILKDIQPSINLDEITIVSNQLSIDYFGKLKKLLLDTPEIELDFLMWIDFVMGIWNKNEVEMERNENIRFRKCMEKVIKTMPIAVTYAIFKSDIATETIPQVQLMAENIRLAFNNSIKQLDWIDDETKQLILDKLHSMKSFVGLPDRLTEADKLDDFYAGLRFNETSHLENILSFHQWEIRRKLKTLHSVGNMELPIKPSDYNSLHYLQYNSISSYPFKIAFVIRIDNY